MLLLVSGTLTSYPPHCLGSLAGVVRNPAEVVCVCACLCVGFWRCVDIAPTRALGEGRVESQLLGFHHAGGEGSDQDWHPADKL